jgi:hypothetical protein
VPNTVGIIAYGKWSKSTARLLWACPSHTGWIQISPPLDVLFCLFSSQPTLISVIIRLSYFFLFSIVGLKVPFVP